MYYYIYVTLQMEERKQEIDFLYIGLVSRQVQIVLPSKLRMLW